MTTGVLDADKRRILGVQCALVQREQFFLAGGTGLGLRFGHRVSRDLDWFTPRSFDVKALARSLSELPEKPSEIELAGPHTVRAYYGELETSFIRYTQVAARPELLAVGRLQVPVGDLETLAVMKAAAVHDRGTQRDFIDIHAICSAPGWSVGRFIDLATRRLPLSPLQMKLALTYFVDADRASLPLGYKVPWKQVKTDLQRGVQAWERDQDLGR